MALKINASSQDREKIDALMEAAGYTHQRKKYHCTLGFIENSIPDEEVQSFGEQIVLDMLAYLQKNPLVYEVKKVELVFHRVVAFLPNDMSRVKLQEANQWLFEQISEVSRGRWGLNKETIPENYIPHMTVWRTRKPDQKLKILQESLKEVHAFRLTDPAFVLL